MLPEQQAVTDLTNFVTTFRELGLPLAILFTIVLTVVAVIIGLIVYYRLRLAMDAREQARDKADERTEASEQGIIKTVLEAFAESSRTQVEYGQAVIKNTAIQLETNELMRKSLEANTATVQTVADRNHQATLAVGVQTAEIKVVIDRLYERFVQTFPTQSSMDERFADFKREVLAAIERKCEEAKRSTDEKPAVNVTPIEPQEDASALTPGASEAA